MAQRPKPSVSVGGRFYSSPPTEEQLDLALAEIRRLELHSICIVGERPDGSGAIVPVNMTSINHMVEVIDRAISSMAAWPGRTAAKR